MCADAAEPPPEWLERANRLALVARLLSGTVHDVNNLLQVMSGNAELLEAAAAGNEAVERRAQSIRSTAQRASGLLAGVQAFARSDGDRAARVDVRQIAAQALALRQHPIAKARITAAVEPDTPVFAHAAPRAVLHIVLNLIANAERALADRPDSRLHLRAAANGDRVDLTVEDNGPGLPAGVVARLFHPQMDAAPPGLGVGLAVSEWLARTQGGALTHAQPAGGGCAMTLTLPGA